MEVFGSTKIFENGVYYVVVVTIIFHEMEKTKVTEFIDTLSPS